MIDPNKLNKQWQIEDTDISILLQALDELLTSQENAADLPEETLQYRRQLLEILKDINLSITFQECNVLLQLIPKPRETRKQT